MRTIGRLILSAVVLLLTGLLAAVAIYLPDFFFGFYTNFSKQVLNTLAGITGVFPFAVWEILVVLLVLLALYFLIHNRKFLSWLSGVALLICVLFFAFVALWGLNHFGPSISDRVGLAVTQYSKEQLAAAAGYMADQATLWADQVPREADGSMTTDFVAWAKQANTGYDVLAQENGFFAGSKAPVKKLLSGRLFSYMGFTGIFIAYTGESNVNPETFSASLPFTMCHELAHRLTVAAEDEANFCAFLACLENPDPAFQYSGWYSAFVYTYNALYAADRTLAAQVWERAGETLRQDCSRANAHYDQFEGQVQEVAQKANDTYLKVFKEESGVQSYGEVADLLIAWYLASAA